MFFHPCVQIQPSLIKSETSKALVEFLNQQSSDSIPVSVQRQDGNGQLYTVRSLALRFTTSNNMVASSEDASKTSTFQSTQVDTLQSPMVSRVEVGAGEAMMFEVDRYLREFIRNSPLSEHETFNHPVAHIHLMTPDGRLPGASSSAGGDDLVAMYVGQDVLNFHLLLSTTEQEKLTAQQTLNQIKRQYGLSCFLLHLDESSDGFASVKSNCDSLLLFLREFTSQNLVPFMDKLCQQWNEQFMNNRRGITGRLFQAGRKYFSVTSNTSKQSSSSSRTIFVTPSASNNNRGSILLFPHSSTEACLRKLADFSYMLNDFRFALVVYESLKKDFQQEKAYRYYAAVQEMIGLCSLHVNERRDVDSIYESSVSTYLDQGYTRDAFRCALLYHEMFKSMGNYKDAARVLTRMVNELDSAKSALLYEQAAYCSLQMDVKRKYAFYLFLAAEKYLACSDFDHAMRCLLKAKGIYSSKKWTLIMDQINYHLSKRLFESGNAIEALSTADQLIHPSQSKSEAQEKFLALFTEIHQSLEKKVHSSAAVLEVHLESLKVINSGGSQEAAVSDNDEMESQWKSLESSFQSQKGAKEVAVFAVREPFIVRMTIRNPLAINLRTDRVFLQFQVGESVDSAIRQPVLSSDDGSLLKFEEYWIEIKDGITFTPHEEVELEWKVMPQKPGAIQVTGVSFILNGVVPFKMPLEAKNNHLAKRMKIQITPPMPRLEVSLESALPDTILSGECVQFRLFFKNVGEHSISFINAKVSHPSFFLFGNMQSDKVSRNCLQDQNIIGITLTEQMKPQTSQIITVWLRGDKIGRHNFKFMFEYGISERKSRCLRFSTSVVVLPSVRVNAFTRPSEQSPHRHVLGMELENLLASADVELVKIHAISSNWRLCAQPMTRNTLHHGQTKFMYHTLEEVIKDQSHCPERTTAENLKKLLFGETKFLSFAELDIVHSDGGFHDASQSSNDQLANRFSEQIKKEWRMQQLNTMYPAIPSSKMHNIFPLYNSNDVDLIVYWQIPSTDRFGQHHVVGMNVGLQQQAIPPSWNLKKQIQLHPGRSLFARTEHEKNALIRSILQNRHVPKARAPVCVHMKCQDRFTIDFEAGSFHWISMVLSIVNLSWFPEDLTYRLDLSRDAGETTDIKWRGATSYEGQLKTGETKLISPKVWIAKAGMYNVNRWKLTVTNGANASERLVHVVEPSGPCWVTVDAKQVDEGKQLPKQLLVDINSLTLHESPIIETTVEPLREKEEEEINLLA
eukprot:Partr_v1_DN28579_c0_g1_i2_m72538 putative trafficking protein particle complex